MKPRHVIVAAALVAAVLLTRLLFATDEARIRRALDAMAAIATVGADEDQIVALARARRLAAFFTPDCQALDLATGDVAGGREAAARAVAWARESYGPAEVSVENVQVVLHAEKADVTATVRVEGPEGGVDEFDRSRVSMEWREVEGGWLIATVAVDRPGVTSR